MGYVYIWGGHAYVEYSVHLEYLEDSLNAWSR